MNSPSEPDDPLNAITDSLATAMRRMFLSSQRGVSRVARSSRRRLELRQLERDRDAFWVRLGKTAYHLTQGGEIDHPALWKAMKRIDELEAQIEDERAQHRE